MSGYRLTPAARKDLSQIWDYTETHWGAKQAATYIRELGQAIERLSKNPNIGQGMDQIAAGYRRHAVGRHVVFYRIEASNIDVVRVLHQRTDPTSHL